MNWVETYMYDSQHMHMTQDDIALLEHSIDKVVRLRCTDGELIIAKVDSVDTMDEEIVYEMLSP